MADGVSRLDGFLRDLRARLRGLSDTEMNEIVEELRSHVRDSAGDAPTDGAVAAVLERLGSPAELASQFATERLLAQAGRSGSPWLLARGLLRWASLSVGGSVALFSLMTGYVLGASLLIAALVKPFAPGRAGLWRFAGDHFSLRLGLIASPTGGEELLGWWIVPIGLLAGGGSLWLTTRFGRWAIRRFRRAPLAPTR